MNAVAQAVPVAAVSRQKWIRVPVIAGRLLLAGIFIFAAYAKMKPQIPVPWSFNSIETSLSMFAMQVDSYQMLRPQQVLRVAHFLPPFELFLGLWLLSGIATRFSTAATTLVMTGFFALMIRTYALGLSINCGCFGTSEQVGPRKILEDGSFFALALLVAVGTFWLHHTKSRRASSAGNSANAPAVAPHQS
jgi:uncharacterized membrane protein YphA (DoxX/SURF4 family)